MKKALLGVVAMLLLAGSVMPASAMARHGKKVKHHHVKRHKK